MCNKHTKFELDWLSRKHMLLFYFSGAAVPLKFAQSPGNWNGRANCNGGDHQAQIQISHLNSLRAKPNVTVSAKSGNMSIISVN